MQSILVTGGSGFVAYHIIQTFLSHGYRVRTTVRSSSKADLVLEAHHQFMGRLDVVIVPDVAAPGAHDEAVKGVHGVVHAASPFSFDVVDVRRQLLDPAVNGTTSILRSIKLHAPQVKRVVVTSSLAAIVDFGKGMRPGYTYTEEDWNPTTFEQATSCPPPVAYAAAKALAEKSAYDLVEQERPNFSIMTICPTMIYGPVSPLADRATLNTSIKEIWRFVDGSLAGRDVPRTSMPAFVDVRDVALAHLKAYQVVDPADHRFLIGAGSYLNADIVRIIGEGFPEFQGRLPNSADTANVSTYGIDNSRSVAQLGMTYRSLKETILDTIQSCVNIQRDV